MLLHRSQYPESSLVSFVVVVIDIVFDHSYKLFAAVEALAIITFSLQDPPESFHWSIVDALRYSGHTLSHAGIFQFGMECPVGVLESSVAVAKGSSSRISAHCLVESSEHQRIVIMVTDHI